MRTVGIYINHDQYIKWIDFDATSVAPVDVDLHIQPLRDFFKSLEVSCVAECCGLDAFSFFSEYVIRAAEEFEQDDLLDRIDVFITHITKLDGIVSSNHLNALMHASVLLQILDHIRRVIKNHSKVN